MEGVLLCALLLGLWRMWGAMRSFWRICKIRRLQMEANSRRYSVRRRSYASPRAEG